MRDIGLEGKVALVTGAAGGIGGAVARTFLEAGATVVATDVAGTGERLAALGAEAPGRVFVTEGNIADEGDVRRVIDLALSDAGGLDCLANVAAVTGAALTDDGDIVSTPLEVWDHVVDVNLRGTMLMCRHAVTAMLECGGGSIVNVSSGAAVRGGHNLAAYSASKAAVNQMTLHIARAFGHRGIRCNCVMPGMIAGTGAMGHPMLVPDYLEAAARATTVGRLGAPTDIAHLVVFLSSGLAAGYISGQVISCDGGSSV